MYLDPPTFGVSWRTTTPHDLPHEKASSQGIPKVGGSWYVSLFHPADPFNSWSPNRTHLEAPIAVSPHLFAPIGAPVSNRAAGRRLPR